MDTQDPHTKTQTLYAGLAGGCFVGVTQLLGRDTLSPCLHWSVGLFAFAIPGLLLFSIKKFHTFTGSTCSDLFLGFFFFLSLAAALLGMVCLFAHFHPAYGAVLSFSAGSAVLGVRILRGRQRPP